MKNYFTIIILFFALSFNAQSRNDKKIFLDSIGMETTAGKHKYFRIIKDYYLKKDKYDMIEYYLDYQIKTEGTFNNKYLNYPSGDYKEYYPSGKIKSIRKIATTDLGSDIYYSFHENGNKEIEGEYLKIKNGKKIDSKLKITSYWTEENIQQVINGEGFMVEKGDFETSSGAIKLGLKDGIWKGINTTHKISFKDNYNLGIFKEGTSKNENNEEFHYTRIHQFAEFLNGKNKFKKFVEKNLFPPDIGKSYKGRMLITFIVDINGDFKDIGIIESINKECDIEGFNLLLSSQKMWKPALHRGFKTKEKLIFPLALEFIINR